MTIFADKDVKEETAESLLEILGDSDAVMFCMQLLYAYHFWDDIYDGEKRSKDDLYQAFSITMIDIRRNPFYLRFQPQLDTLIASSFLQWMDANKLEESKEHLNKAYMLRANIIQIWAYCAFLIGGMEHYKNVGVVIQKMYQEDFNEYCEEINNA